MGLSSHEEKEFEAERLLGDIHIKVNQLLAADIEAHEAGVTDGPLPNLGGDWEGWLEEDERTTGKQAWQEVKALAERERKQLVLDRRKRFFQSLLVQHLVNDWFKRNSTIMDGKEISAAARTVENLLREDRGHEAELYLRDVLVSGRRFADKEQKKRKTGRWAWLSYLFATIRGLIYAAAVLAVFSAAHSQFEKVSMAVVVIIGNMLLTNREIDNLYRLRFGTEIDAHFNSLRRFFKVPEEEDERKKREKTRFESDRSFGITTVSAFVAFLFEAVVWLSSLQRMGSAHSRS